MRSISPADATLVGLLSQFGVAPLPPAKRVPDLEIQSVERELGVALPPIYRSFLHHFGAVRGCGREVFGLPRHGLAGDVVLENQLPGGAGAAGYVKIARGRGGVEYYLATGQRTADGDCPVVLLGPTPVARSFLHFLRLAAGGEV